MKKILTLILLNLMIFSCDGPTPEPVNEPLPVIDGKLIIKFTDPKLEIKPETSVSNDDVLAISFNIRKGTDGNRPLKMSVYITNNLDTKGTLLMENIKLKEVDEQTRSIEFNLPSIGVNISRVFYVEITDNKSKITRKSLSVLQPGFKQICAWNNVTLGVQNSGLASRFSSATGDAYTACDLDSNLNFIDVTYATIGTPAKPTFVSNPRRSALNLGTTASDKNCSNINTTGGTAVFYAPITPSFDFGSANDFGLNSLNIPTTTQDLPVEVGKAYMFQHTRTTKNGKVTIRKGVIKVNSITNVFPTTGAVLTAGLINFDVKMQK